MKNFLSANWYKLMIGSSMLMASLGFLVYSITPVSASSPDKNKVVVVPVNDDGSISVKLTGDQLKLLTPKDIQDVNIEQIRGVNAAYIEGSISSDDVRSLGTCPHTAFKKMID